MSILATDSVWFELETQWESVASGPMRMLEEFIEAGKMKVFYGSSVENTVGLARVAIGSLLEWRSLNGLPEDEAYLFFDRADEFMVGIKRQFIRHENRRRSRPNNPRNWWDDIADITDVNIDKYPGVQILEPVFVARLYERKRD